MKYPAFERILYELLTKSEEEARFNESRAFTYLKNTFKQELPQDYQEPLKYLISLARDVLQESNLLLADNRGSAYFTISKDGEKLLAQKKSDNQTEIFFEELMQYTSFVDFVNYQVTEKINKNYEDKYHLAIDLAMIAEEKKRYMPLYQADEFLTLYDKEINARLNFFRVYDIKKEDVEKDKRKKLQVVMSLNRSLSLLRKEEIPTPPQNKLLILDIFNVAAQHAQRLREELLKKVKTITPLQFEELSVLVLAHLLYPNQPFSHFKKHLKQLGQSGDGGIDGVVTVHDRIRGDIIHYIQSKRYTTNSVQRPEVQRFVGALDPHRAKIGVFMTTSIFTTGAKDYVNSLNLYSVRLIDGNELIEMMIEHEIGIKKLNDIALFDINDDFFNNPNSWLN